MSLAAVAERFEAAGVAPAERALTSLKRCKPARLPVYRDGDRYALDPNGDELRRWLVRLDLRAPCVPCVEPVRREPEPLPGPDERLTVAELEEAWRGATFWSWSAQRLAIVVLDAHGRPMTAAEVVAFVRERGKESVLTEASAAHWHRRSAVRVRDDGRWELVPRHDAIISARRAVRQRIELVRRWAAARPDPDVIAANRRAANEARASRAAQLAGLSRVLVRTSPPGAPEVVVLADVAKRCLETFGADELDKACERMASYDVIGAVDVRASLEALGLDPGRRRLAELGPPQKTRKLNKSGRTLKITLSMLVTGSCGIARPFGDRNKLREYLRKGETTRFRRRLEADAKSLYAMYQYGRLHGALRLRWGFLDEVIPVPWVNRDEPMLHDLKRRAHEGGTALQVVIGSAPGWADPWSRARLCRVEPAGVRYGYDLIDEHGCPVDDCLVQLARPVAGGSSELRLAAANRGGPPSGVAGRCCQARGAVRSPTTLMGLSVLHGAFQQLVQRLGGTLLPASGGAEVGRARVTIGNVAVLHRRASVIPS